MKSLITLIWMAPAFAWAFQTPYSTSAPTSTAPNQTNKIELRCRLYNITGNVDSINLYEQVGMGFKTIARAGRRAVDSLFVFNIPGGQPRFYLVGAYETSVCKVILGAEPQVTLYANIQFMNKGRTVGSPINKALEEAQKRIDYFFEESEIAVAQYRAGTGTAKKLAENNVMRLEKAKTAYLDSLKTSNPLLWRMAILQITPDYRGQKGFDNEVDFVGKTYFSNAPLATDRQFDQIPEVLTAFERFGGALSNLGANPEKIEAYFKEAVQQIPKESRTYRMAMGGMINALKAANSPLYMTMARQYIDLYKRENAGDISRLEYDLKKAGTFTPGFEAPDLVGMTPDSATFSLSKLRGKVVLIDFWASWCGPCRKENPNVKANYEKYKAKGFEVFGVSLDRDGNAWRNAIKQDGLMWHHISDLKGWQSEHAQLYSVNSIPQTLLIDKEGKIIVRNIRGEQLGQKLKEIFGE